MSHLIPIAIDPGHGTDTWNKVTQTGSKGIGNFAEFDFNSPVARKTKALAEANGFRVVLTQPLDGKDVSLSARTNLARQEGVKAFVSIHADANADPAAKGHYAFYWHTNPEAKRLAVIWAKYSKEYMKNPARGDNGTLASIPDTWTEFHMCREPNKVGIPSILIEHAFFTNPQELQLLKTDSFQQACAISIVRALCEFFNVPFRSDIPVPICTEMYPVGTNAVVNTDKLNLRSTPDGEVVGQLVKGDSVKLLGKTGEWAKVDVNLGETWVWNAYLAYVAPLMSTPTPAIPPVTTPAVTLPWQQQQGLDAVAYLKSIGQIDKPETWTAAKMDESAPTWLVMSLIARSQGMKK